jgi:hypothetical protein
MSSIKLRWALALTVLAAMAAAATALPAASSSPTALDGVYRISWTEKELVAAGTSPLFARRNHAVVMLRASDSGDEIAWGRKPWKKIG